MYVKAETKHISGYECFKYNEIEAYVDPTLERFLALVESGAIYVDFDARTGHNHGTKFRIRPAAKNDLYQQHIIVYVVHWQESSQSILFAWVDFRLI